MTGGAEEEEQLPRTQPGTSGPSLNLAIAPRAPGRRGGGLSTGQMALMTFAALVMGVLALLRVDSSALGDLGLVTVVGPVYFVAIGVVIASYGFALCQRPLRRSLLAFQLIGLIALLDGLGPLVEPHASFATCGCTPASRSTSPSTAPRSPRSTPASPGPVSSHSPPSCPGPPASTAPWPSCGGRR